MANTLTISPWLYRSKINSKGVAPIYYKLKLRDQETQLSSGICIKPEMWDEKKCSVKSKYDKVEGVNKEIDLDRQKLKKIYQELKESSQTFTVIHIKEIFCGKDPFSKSLVEAIDYYSELLKGQIGKGTALGTYEGYCYFKKKIIAFLNFKGFANNYPLKDINHQFIVEYENYMKKHHNNNQNSASKQLNRLKRIINFSMDMDWIIKSPFRKIKIKKTVPERTYLTEEELLKLEAFEPPTEYLQLVKDCSLAQIYIGASFLDLKGLTTHNISIDMEGQKWIVYFRNKTNKKASIPVLPQVEELIQKYAAYSCRTKGYLFPIPSNQKMNKGIKKLMAACKIEKNISSHSFRRTFATTIAVLNGVSMEATRDMLGQTDVRTTQIYAAVEDLKISSEMKKVISKLKKVS